MEKIKRIALVAHDNRKKDMLDWVEKNWEVISNQQLTCTGTTGSLVHELLSQKTQKTINIKRLKSGPLGGDQQLGALIASGDIDIVIFFWDPMQPQPHDVDVKALLRIAVLYNVPMACNRSTADFVISSELFNEEYQPKIKDYSSYLNREIK